MKNIYILIISIFSFYFSSAQYTWTQRANYGGGIRYGAIAFSIGPNGSIGAKGYVGAGLDGGLNVTNDFWEYDTVSNVWTQKANIGTAGRFGAVGFSIGNYGYVGLGTTYYDGGYNYTWATDFWQYDPTSNTWTQKGNFPAHGRYGISSFTIGNKAYIGGGWSGPNYNDFWEYNPENDTWTQKANLGGSNRQSGTGFSINDKGYITCGLNGSSPLNDLWEYDTLANSWSQKANFPGTARFAATGFTLCNDAFVGLGSSNYPVEVELNDFWKYDQAADRWALVAFLPDSARNGAAVFVIGDNAYIGTGAASTATSGFTNDFWKFNTDSCRITLGLQNYAVDNLISLYPNPVSTQITLETSFLHNEVVTMSVVDVLGREALSPALLHGEKGMASIDVSGLESGIYFLELVSEKGRWVEKFVKE